LVRTHHNDQFDGRKFRAWQDPVKPSKPGL
jgi:hypothetical protein